MLWHKVKQEWVKYASLGVPLHRRSSKVEALVSMRDRPGPCAKHAPQMLTPAEGRATNDTGEVRWGRSWWCVTGTERADRGTPAHQPRTFLSATSSVTSVTSSWHPPETASILRQRRVT